MPTFTQKEVEEINEIIKAIQSAIKPKMEIGARDKVVLMGLLQANKIKKTPKVFKCKREHSEAIVSYFVKDKDVPRSRFSGGQQTAVFLL
jgi:hypothetical protein